MERSDTSLDRRKKRKKCRCWCIHKISSLLCTNIGLFVVIMVYLVIGGMIFSELESAYDIRRINRLVNLRNQTILKLWNITMDTNILQEKNWTAMTNVEIIAFQRSLFDEYRDGYDGFQVYYQGKSQQWSFIGSFIYSFTLITTLGHGNISPRTNTGKMVAILYAIIGIPLMLIFLNQIGFLLANGAERLHRKMCSSCGRRPSSGLDDVAGDAGGERGGGGGSGGGCCPSSASISSTSGSLANNKESPSNLSSAMLTNHQHHHHHHHHQHSHCHSGSQTGHGISSVPMMNATNNPQHTNLHSDNYHHVHHMAMNEIGANSTGTGTNVNSNNNNSVNNPNSNTNNLTSRIGNINNSGTINLNSSHQQQHHVSMINCNSTSSNSNIPVSSTDNSGHQHQNVINTSSTTVANSVNDPYQQQQLKSSCTNMTCTYSCDPSTGQHPLNSDHHHHHHHQDTLMYCDGPTTELTPNGPEVITGHHHICSESQQQQLKLSTDNDPVTATLYGHCGGLIINRTGTLSDKLQHDLNECTTDDTNTILGTTYISATSNNPYSQHHLHHSQSQHTHHHHNHHPNYQSLPPHQQPPATIHGTLVQTSGAGGCCGGGGGGNRDTGFLSNSTPICRYGACDDYDMMMMNTMMPHYSIIDGGGGGGDISSPSSIMFSHYHHSNPHYSSLSSTGSSIPILLSMLLIVAYLMLGSIWLHISEKLTLFECVYYCFTSILTIDLNTSYGLFFTSSSPPHSKHSPTTGPPTTTTTSDTITSLVPSTPMAINEAILSAQQKLCLFCGFTIGGLALLAMLINSVRARNRYKSISSLPITCYYYCPQCQHYHHHSVPPPINNSDINLRSSKRNKRKFLRTSDDDNESHHLRHHQHRSKGTTTSTTSDHHMMTNLTSQPATTNPLLSEDDFDI
ncbi:uncharacterized protein LOC141853270 [Brevipalpus obovatus]|uniref:uncharacterized protein LOC141853270 n=1 Tax=Brevipalpus obovatus TaxID=246614 RepID=UPI003D9E8400